MTGHTMLRAMGEIDENLVLDAQEVFMNENKKHLRPIRIAAIVAAAALLLSGTILAARHYTRAADKAEERWNEYAETEMTQEQKDYVDERSADVCETAEDQGITFTVESVTVSGSRVYVNALVTADKERYDFTRMSCHPSLPVWTLENDSFGVIRSSTGGGGGEAMEDGTYTMQAELTFELPEGANPGDGKTVLKMSADTMYMYRLDENGLPIDPDDEANYQVEGSWNIAVPLPAVETAEGIAITDAGDLAENISAEISDVKITESGLDLSLRFLGAEYTLIGSDNIELARAAEPDTLFFTVEALTESGDRLPTRGASGTLDEETGIWNESVLWLAPVDPETVVSLVFSDGEAETVIDVE